MKIVVLDGFTLNPGDLDWSPLDDLGNVSVYDRTTQELVVARAAAADIVLTNKVELGPTELAGLPRLRYIGVLATGVNVVDLQAARRRNIVVTNVPAYSTDSVAQHVFALLFELTRGVGHHAALVRAGRWAEAADFCFWDAPQIELSGKTLGIVGFGRIGQAVSKIAQALNMSVIIHTRSPEPERWPEFKFVSIDAVFEESDVVSLHCPLTEDTEHLVNASHLASMKKTAYLINTGRGPLVDEGDLANALAERAIAGAGLDVLSQEPPSRDNPLLSAPNCLITPHLAWATLAARQRLMDIAVANVRRFLDGATQNRVN
jgi:glycerate dehydrogenase